jgi:hypothetical protein
MFAIQCPQCGESTSISLTNSVYTGPYRCWKCRAAFLIRIEDGKVKSYEPISEERFQQYLT